MEELRESLPPVQSFFLGDEGAESTLPKPKDPNGPWTPGDVISRTQVGALVELSTNPLYLYAMYSVKDTNEGRPARDKLRDILHQEMLHLALVGNILSALGHSLDLYNFGVVPRYRGHVLMDEIPMDLRPLDAESLGYFIKIESPDTVPFNDPKVIAKEYRSIGELYENLIAGVQKLDDRDFKNNKDRQFTKNDFFDQLTVITDKATALKAFKLIIEQGEGTGDNSHFRIFSELLKRFRLNPWGVHNVPNNPKTEDYKTKPYIYKLSLAFDAAYCYLLQNIQRVWIRSENVSRDVLIRNIRTIMTDVLTPLATILVEQPLGNGVAAAPCFNYYPMRTDDPRLPGNPLTPEELHKQLSNRMQDAVVEAPEAQKSALKRIKGDADKSKPSA